MIAPDVILLDDPRRGIDIGTKQEICRTMRALAGEGKAILFYASDDTALIGSSDRVIVLCDGQVVRELSGDEITEEAIVFASLSIGDAA